MIQMLWTSKFGRKRADFAATGLRSIPDKTADIHILEELVQSGQFKVIFDRCFSLEQTANAHAYVETGHKKGNVVVAVEATA